MFTLRRRDIHKKHNPESGSIQGLGGFVRYCTMDQQHGRNTSARKESPIPFLHGSESVEIPQIESLVSPGDVTIKIAWERINRNTNQVLFVVDEENRILGSVSDGDVRRWVLKDNSLNEPVNKIMNRKPVVCRLTDGTRKIKAAMVRHKVHCIPLIDASGRMAKVVTWDSIIAEGSGEILMRSTSAASAPTVILAGGFGTRLYPFTKILPKPLVPIGDKPILEHIMDRFRRFGVAEFILSVNYKAAMIKAYFSESPMQDEIRYVQEEKPLGTAGSLGMLKGRIDTDFFVSNCDILIDADYGEMLEHHRKADNDITIVCSMKRTRIPYGVVEINEGGSLKSLREKPEYDNLVNTGMYVVAPEMLDLIPEGQFLHFTDLIEKASALGRKVGVFPIAESAWVDVGQLEDYQSVLSKLPD